MFPFSGSAEGRPVEVEDVALGPEDVFVLLGESLDIGMFAASPFILDLDRYRAEGAGPWRERLIEYLAPLGLVDRSGEPRPDLADALAPLREQGLFVGDGGFPVLKHPLDRRTAVVCLTPDLSRATAVVRCGRRAFRLVRFPEDRSLWEGEFLSLYGLDGSFAWADRAQSYIEPCRIEGGPSLDGLSCVRPILGGRRAVEAWCAERGVDDPGQLARFAAARRNPLSGLLSPGFFVSGDNRECVYTNEFPYRAPLSADEEKCKEWSKVAEVFAPAGLVMSVDVGPLCYELDNPSEAEKHYCAAFDFLGPGQGLLDNLLTFRDWPEGD